MGTLSVRPQSQAVYPDGFQDSFVIKNNGPFTVYADSDTTVNAQSLAIPPTGSLPWDKERPLFVSLDPAIAANIADAFSTVALVRNSQAAIFVNDVDNILWQEASGSNNVTSPLIETAAYSSIQIRVGIGAAVWSGALPGVHAVVVTWYDSAFNAISQDAARMIPAYAVSGGVGSSRANFDVKGTYVSLVFVHSGGMQPHTTTLIGTTRKLRPGMAAGYPDAQCKATNVGPTTQAVATRSVYLDYPGTASDSLYLPNLGPKLDITWREVAGGGVGSGAMGLLNGAFTNEYYNFVQGLGATITTLTTVVPLYEPMRLDLQFRSVETAISLRWYD